MTTSNNDSNYQSIVQSSDIISNLKKDSTFHYAQIKEEFMEPALVGAMAIDEYKMNPLFLESYVRWNMEDSAYNCMMNAQRLYSKQQFDENKYIRSSSVDKTSGLAKKEVNMKGFDEDNVNHFDDVTGSTISSMNVPLSSGKAVELYGYFTSNVSGVHTFSIPTLAVYQLWVKNDSAVIHYNKNNADVNSFKGNASSSQKSVEMMVEKGHYYAIRVQLGNSGKNAYNGGLLSVFLPDGTQVASNNEFQFFNSLNYEKKPFYFALVKNPSSKSNSPVFQCHFFNEANHEKIRTLKTNFPLVYNHVEVPTTITYTSGIYNKQAQQGTPINVENPVGSEMEIVKSKWGYDKIQTETVRIDPKFVDYNPDTEAAFLNDVINENSAQGCPQLTYSEYKKYESGNLAKYYSEGVKKTGDGFFVRKYIGKTIDEVKTGIDTLVPNSYSTEKMIGVGARDGANFSDSVKNVTNGEGFSTYVFDANLTHNLNNYKWISILAEAKGTAHVYINGTYYFSNRDYGSDWSSGHPMKQYKDLKSIRIYYQSDASQYGLRLSFRERYKSRRKWRWGGFVNIGHSGYLLPKYDLDVLENRDCKYSIKAKDPVPKKEVFNYQTNDILPSFVDTKKSLNKKIDGNVMNLEGDYSNYNNLLDERVQGASNDKTMNVNYKFSQTFDTNGESAIKNKNIHVDLSGDLVIGYDYNGTTNSYPISFLPRNQQCDGKTLCEYYLRLEDNCSLSLYNNDNSKIWNKPLLPESVNVDVIAQNSMWLKNPERRSILNVGEKLSPADISEIISDNGKYKLSFIDGKLTVTYGTLAYNRIFNENRDIFFTSNDHVVDGKQLYFLYKAQSHELMGKRVFASNTTDSDNNPVKTIDILPEDYDKVLKFDKYEKEADTYPVFANNAYVNLGSDQSVVSQYNVSSILSEEQCAAECKDSNQCDHFFYLKTDAESYCLQDKVNNTLPIRTKKQPHNKISSSSMSMKTYAIESECLNNGKQSLEKNSATAYSDFGIVYESSLENDPTKTFLCSNDTYVMNRARINEIYAGNPQGQTESFATLEGYSNTEFGTAKDIIEYKINPLMDMAKIYDENNAKHAETDAELDALYASYVDLSGKEIISKAKANDGIPDKFKKEVSDNINTTKLDGMERDAKTLLMYENTMYTIATLSAATLVVAMIVLSRD